MDQGCRVFRTPLRFRFERELPHTFITHGLSDFLRLSSQSKDLQQGFVVALLVSAAIPIRMVVDHLPGTVHVRNFTGAKGASYSCAAAIK